MATEGSLGGECVIGATVTLFVPSSPRCAVSKAGLDALRTARRALVLPEIRYQITRPNSAHVVPMWPRLNSIRPEEY